MSNQPVNHHYRQARFLISAASPSQFPADYFSLDEKRRLVDLPGYGFAKVPLAVKDEWQRLMGQYLEQKTLRGLVIIMDIRHPLKEFDLQMLDWCRHYGLPAHVLLTKADKLNRGGQQNTLLKSRKILKAEGYDASMQTFSSLKKAGLDELVHKLNDWLELE
jgi:GTP-binding protein